jgi:ribosomal protein L11 methyltransferase
MMDYIEVNFKIDMNSPEMEILIAQLSEIGFDGFMESADGLLAYIPEENFSEDLLHDLVVPDQSQSQLNFILKTIKEQNWNAVWESNYDPVIIKNLVYIRAPFHPTNPTIKYEILVDPKMSFGTAHHETTALMIEMILEEEMNGKSVLDMGCGTGILAILSEMMGAIDIDAIDNDVWAYNNSLENIVKNNCKNISVKQGDADDLKSGEYEYILANINRNVLVRDIVTYATHMGKNGILLLSGFYTEDLDLIESTARANNLSLTNKKVKNNWVAAKFVKN